MGKYLKERPLIMALIGIVLLIIGFATTATIFPANLIFVGIGGFMFGRGLALIRLG